MYPTHAMHSALAVMLVDQDIAHIGRVMHQSLRGDLGGPILPSTYWRGRLHALLDAAHLTRAQLCAIDALLLQLDRFDADVPQALALVPPAVAQSLHGAAPACYG